MQKRKRVWRFDGSDRRPKRSPALIAVLAGSWIFFGWLAAPRPAVAADLTCAYYCASLAASCPEEVLHNVASCEAFCGHPELEALPAGTLGDTTGNTLGCRIHHADEAASRTGAARESFCAAASLAGGGTCGSYCENYCQIVVNTCNQANNADYPAGKAEYFDPDEGETMASCLLECGGYATDVLTGISQTEGLFGYGDTVQCRLHHAHAAIIEGQDSDHNYGLHCEHASPSSTGETCSDAAPPNAVNYCAFALTHCTGANEIFPSGTGHSSCVSTVNTTASSGSYESGPFQSFTDNDTNSLGCLNYWIMLTPQDATLYCAKGDWDPANWQPGGDGVCIASVSVPALPDGSLPLSVALAIAGAMVLGAAGIFARGRFRQGVR